MRLLPLQYEVSSFSAQCRYRGGQRFMALVRCKCLKLLKNWPFGGDAMFAHLYDERKASDAARYLLVRADGTLQSATLIRLLYLAERESFKQHGLPLTGDSLVAFDEGPSLWHTHQRLVGEVQSWENWVSDLANYQLGIRPSKLLHAQEYFESRTALSRSDIATLDTIWGKFGSVPAGRLLDIIQTECPEWTRSSHTPEIKHEALFRALGLSEAQISGLLEQLIEIDSINQLMAESTA
jgi:uncharacterized phage-associated protein